MKRMMVSLCGMMCALGAWAQNDAMTPTVESARRAGASLLKAAGPAAEAGNSIGSLMWLVPVAAILAIIFAWIFYVGVKKANPGNAKMVEIAGYVTEGAMAYLKAQFAVVIKVIIALFVVLVVLSALGLQNRLVPVAFLTGALFSALCGYLGMKTATMASSRTAQGASESLNKGLTVAFRSGAVMGLVVVGFGLLMIWIWWTILDKVVYTPDHMKNGFSFIVTAGFDASTKLQQVTTTMLGFGIGASLMALFARVGGGIYTKAADVGADLVGKVEAGIPEDDPRNPATIADNVGDNVGDVAGMGADLYESYCGSILATAALGAAMPAFSEKFSSLNAVQAPMIVAGIGILLSIFGAFLVKCGDDASMKKLMHALERGVNVASVLIVVVLAVLSSMGMLPWGVSIATVAGLIAGIVIGKATNWYTSDEYRWVKGIAGQAKTGPATVIIDGLAVGMHSAAIPVVAIVIGILVAFGAAGGFTNHDQGLYGIAFAAVGMLATLGVTLATDAYGPIADNAGGNAEMSGLPPQVRERTDALDMLGNTTAAIGKGFAIGSAALTALALLVTYYQSVQFWGKKIHPDMPTAQIIGDLSLTSPLVICGLFLGGMLALVFCALTMKAVGRAAGAMVEEVRRQFREIPGIMEGKGKPDYQNCVAISTKSALREMVLPSLLAVIIPIVVGLILGVGGLLGLLAGGLAAGFSLACLLNNAGGAWDNAKKYVEKQEKTYEAGDKDKKHPLTGKGSDVHKACVTGDTVGDPCKDTSGPSLNILIKLMSMVAVVFAPVIVKFAPMIQSALGLTSH